MAHVDEGEENDEDGTERLDSGGAHGAAGGIVQECDGEIPSGWIGGPMIPP